MKYSVWLYLLSGAFLCFRSLNAQQALFITGNTSLNSGDQAVYNILSSEGWTVKVTNAATAQSTDTSGCDLVLISSTVSSSIVGSKFRDVEKPVIVWEGYVFDDMKMTEPDEGYFGYTDSQTTITVVEGTHPMAAGLSPRNHIALSTPGTMMWGKPSQGAYTIATMESNSEQACIFGYEKGVTMAGKEAPARRVGFFWHDETPASATAEGILLFRAALAWATALPDNSVCHVNVSSREGGTVSGSGWYAMGTDITLRAIPQDGYVFKGWEKEGTVISEEENFSYTVMSDIDLEAIFEYSGTPAMAQIQLNPMITFQTIRGFGGFGAKEVWWGSPPYYDKTFVDWIADSLGCTFVRTQIYWDGEPVNDDNNPYTFNWAGFNFGPNSGNGKQFSYIKELATRGIKILATVWTPPVWMKDLSDPTRIPGQCYNCAYGGDCSMCGGKLKPEYYDEFAEYLVAYLKAVKQQTGVDIYAINIQNEPYFANPFESCVTYPEEYADILKTVGQRFASEGITTRLFGPEHMGEVTWGVNTRYMDEILNDNQVKGYLDFYAVHSYVDGVAPDYGSAEGWSTLYQQVSAVYGKEIWMTETSGYPTTWDGALDLARSMHLALRFGKISGWVYWQMSGDIIENNVPNSKFYVFKNYYKYIQPGALQIQSESSDPGLLVTAFKHLENKKLVVVIINNSDFSKVPEIILPRVTKGSPYPTRYRVYRTSETENCKDYGYIQPEEVILPPRSVTTLIWDDYEETGWGNATNMPVPSIEVYPNPARNTLKILSKEQPILDASILNTEGKPVYRIYIGGKNEFSIPIQFIDPGFYFLQLKTAEKNVFIRFLKQ